MRSLLTVVVMISLCAVAAAPAQAAGGLTPAQFTALDRAQAAFLPLTGDNPPAAAFDAARAACTELDSSDPLLAALRQQCTAAANVSAASGAFADCLARVVCLRTARRVRVAMTRLIRTARDVNAAVKRSSVGEACGGELRADRSDLRMLARQRDFFALVERALRTGSARLARRVVREGAAIGRLADRQPSPQRELEKFRFACAPAPG